LSFDQDRLKRQSLDRWAIQEIPVTDNGIAMAKAIQNGTAIAVSDGSYKDGRGTAAFILEISDQFQTAGRIVGVNSIPGETEDQSSYRSELGGVSGIVETVGTLCARHNITFGAVEVGLDGNQAMKNVFGDWPSYPGQADYDLLKDLWEKIRRSPLKWTGRWVERHQDDITRFEDLMDRWGQLNVECDGLAKEYWNACTESEAWGPNHGFAEKSWSVWIEGKKLTKSTNKSCTITPFPNNPKITGQGNTN
jgi:NAD(P)-dependent dehydrogenase (short-subunit alcohol dehydrogenase family)